MEICRIVGFWQGSVTLCTFLRVWDNEWMHFKSRVGRERSIFLTRKDLFSALPFPNQLKYSSAQIEDNMNDYIHHIRQWAFMPVQWRDSLITLCASKRRETTPHQISANQSPGWYPPLSPPPSPSPVAYVQTGSTSALASFSSVLDSAPRPPTVWVNITPYYTFFTVTAHTQTLSKRSSHINGNCMQALPLAAE